MRDPGPVDVCGRGESGSGVDGHLGCNDPPEERYSGSGARIGADEPSGPVTWLTPDLDWRR